MGDITSACKCVIRGFDWYGFHWASLFTTDGGGSTLTQASTVDGNWYPFKLTRVNVLEYSSPLRPSNHPEQSWAYTPPISPLPNPPLTYPDGTSIPMGRCAGVLYNEPEGLLMWLMSFGNYIKGSGDVEWNVDTDELRGAYLLVTDLAGTTVISCTALSTPDPFFPMDPATAIPGWNHQFYNGSFTSEELQIFPWSYAASDGLEYPVFPPMLWGGGIGTLRKDYSSVFLTEYTSDERWHSVGPYTAFSPGVISESFYPSVYPPNTPPAWPEWTHSIYDIYPLSGATNPPPGSLAAFYGTTAPAYAVLAAVHNPDAGFGKSINMTVVEGEGPTGPNPNGYNRITEFTHKLHIGDIVDGVVSGPACRTNTSVFFGYPPGFGSGSDALHIAERMTPYMADTWNGKKVGVYHTYPVALRLARTARGITTVTAGMWHYYYNEAFSSDGSYHPEGYTVTTATIDSPHYTLLDTWPPTTDAVATANKVSITEYLGPTLGGYLYDTPSKIYNNAAIDYDSDESIVAVTDGYIDVVQHPISHMGWKPVAVRVAHDDTEDLIVVDQLEAAGTTNLDSAGHFGGDLYGSGVQETAEWLFSINGEGGARRYCVVVFALDVVPTVSVETTPGSPYPYTTIATGAVGRYKYEAIEVIQAGPGFPIIRVRATRSGVGLMGMAIARGFSSSSGITPAFGTLPPPVPLGTNGCQMAFGTTPLDALPQGQNFGLTGLGTLTPAYKTIGDDEILVGLGNRAVQAWATYADQTWSAGSAMTGTFGVTFRSVALPIVPWTAETAGWAPINHSSVVPTRIRRITSYGSTLWVRRNVGPSSAATQLSLDDKVIYVRAATGRTGDGLLAINALTGAARGFDYPDGAAEPTPPGTTGWYGSSGSSTPLLRWAVPPVRDEQSTPNILEWIDAAQVPYGF